MKILSLEGLNQFFSNLKNIFISKIDFNAHVSEFQEKLDLKVYINQGIDNAGKILTVDAAGTVTPSDQDKLTLVYNENTRTLEFVETVSSYIPNSTLAYSYDGEGNVTLVSKMSTTTDDGSGNITLSS